MWSSHLHMESVPFSGHRLNISKCEQCPIVPEQCLDGGGDGGSSGGMGGRVPAQVPQTSERLPTICWQSTNLGRVALPLHSSTYPTEPVQGHNQNCN